MFKQSLAVLICILTLPSNSWGMDVASVAGKTLYYTGERNTDSKMEIRISPDGKTYTATLYSGKYKYSCQPSKLLPNGFFEITECGTIDIDDPNYDTEVNTPPEIEVDGNLKLVSRSISGGVGGARGNTLEFTLNRQRTFEARPKVDPEANRLRRLELAVRQNELVLRLKEAEAKAKALEIKQKRRSAAAVERKRKVEAAEKKRRALAASQAKAAADKKRRASQAKAAAENKRRSVAAAQAKAAADKKRRASQAKAAAENKRRSVAAAQAKAAADKKRRASQAKAAAENKRRALAASQAKAAAVKKRRASQAKAAAENKRRALAAAQAKAAADKKRRASQVAAAARKKQEAFLSVKDADGAKLFLKDFKDFVSKNPAAFDSFKMAGLFGPAQEAVSKNQYRSKKKTFHKLVEFANSNNKYRAYRVNNQIKRKRDNETRRKSVAENIRQLIVLLRKKVAADPLAPNTYKIIRVVRIYEKPFKGKTLNKLNKILADLSSEMRDVGIEPPIGISSLANNSPRGKNRKTVIPSFRSIPQLRGIKENDIVFLANLNSAAPHTYKDLNGAIKFEKSRIVLCAPKIKDWDRQAFIFAQYKTNGLYPNHGIERGSCKGKIGAVDAIMARGVDLAKSKELPSEVAFAKGFRTKKLSLVFTVKASDVSDELKRRTILSSQYKDDIIEGARSGFGAISGDNKSSVGCVVVSDLRDAHQSFVDQASKARTFQSGIETRKNVDVSLSIAFRQLQKKTCGLIYAGEKSLKKLIEASKNADLKITVLPVWTSASKVERQAAVLLNKENTSKQSKADRLAALKRKLVEDRKQRAARAAELSQRQAQFRRTFGAKVTSLVAAIDTQLKSMRSEIDKTLSNKGSVRAAVKRQGFWGELPGWYGTKRQKGWEFGSTVATPADYGTATWKGRNIKAIVAKVRFLMKQPDLGEYSDTCWYVGYLEDAEFSRQREPFVASCKRPDALKKWFVVNRFQTQWDLGVR